MTVVIKNKDTDGDVQSEDLTIFIHMAILILMSTLAGILVLCFSYKKLAVIELLGPMFIAAAFLANVLNRYEVFVELPEGQYLMVRAMDMIIILMVYIVATLFTGASWFPHVICTTIFALIAIVSWGIDMS